ncbi:hypothetical protein A0H81_11284 [Grifola frondosa]|uniref:Uncharacterized protein n=1 Tax=Grifola frondosa TaxID=5627 RepID=A0A1C7LXE0_GRIFR|nr:hypothetical protein A0H81_11284 [Grifola frondosa]
MSYGNQGRTTESWDTDPNNPNTGAQTGRSGFGQQGEDTSWSSSGGGRPTSDPTDTSSWSSGQQQGQQQGQGQGQGQGRRGGEFESQGGGGGGGFDSGAQWSAGQAGESYGRTGYPQDTSGTDTYGSGGNVGSTGGGDDFGSGGSGDMGSGGGYGAGTGQSGDDQMQGRTGKPSMGERLKGDAEKLAGRFTGKPSMVERGQARKTGDPSDTSYGDNY